VLQKATGKLLSGKGAGLGFAGIGGAITERHHERIQSTTFSAGVSRALSLRVAHLGRKSVAPYRAKIDILPAICTPNAENRSPGGIVPLLEPARQSRRGALIS
jgi:hypothetical protein